MGYESHADKVAGNIPAFANQGKNVAVFAAFCGGKLDALNRAMPTLSSSAIRSVDYDPESRTLTIVFTSSSTAYTFHGVPERVYMGLVMSSSPGTYYNDHIRGRYR